MLSNTVTLNFGLGKHMLLRVAMPHRASREQFCQMDQFLMSNKLTKYVLQVLTIANRVEVCIEAKNVSNIITD